MLLSELDPSQLGFEATPMEIAAHFARISKAEIRAGTIDDMEPPACRIDRNLAIKILVWALKLERESYKSRGRYQHRGKLGDLGIALLQLLMNIGTKYGRIFPSYEKLAALLRKHQDTVLEAMKLLIEAGFVIKHRRSKLVTVQAGGHWVKRRVQDSNAYEVRMPPEVSSSSAPLIAGSSGSDNPQPLSSTPASQSTNQSVETAKDRWFLPEPLKMGNGGCW
jgi:hypothetical protein